MTTDQLKKRLMIGFGVIAGLVLITVIGNMLINHIVLSDVRRYAKARKWKLVEDPTTGNLFCGANTKQAPLEELQTFYICGKSFEAEESKGNIMKKADRLMRDEAKKYANALAKLEARKKKANKSDGILDSIGNWGKKRGFEAEFLAKWGIYIKDKEIAELLHGKNAMRCIRVTSSFRSTVGQYFIFMNSLTPEGHRRWQKGLKIREQDQTFTATEPCRSFHETGRAFDVANWYAAQKYIWEAGLSGGSRGLYRDPYHFSDGELRQRGMGRGARNLCWYVSQKKLSVEIPGCR